ncbi:MAG TPA: response regulator transcription factor [Tepidisphaeraceae bacterium]|nr:response regulator transcription factor [Tepidisphaeraceae bacterium]
MPDPTTAATDPMPAQSARKVFSVLLVDDHPIVREGLAQLINACDDLNVCGEASTAAEALDLLSRANPDVVIVDISLTDRNGVELIKDIVAQRPGLPCLALSMYDEAMYALRVLRAGGRGYIMKQEVPKKVIAAIRQVLAGHVYLSEAMSTRLVNQVVNSSPGSMPPVAELSDRELEVLTLIGRGQSTREIAEKLFLSVKTVEAHRERIKDKLKLKNGTELLRYAMQFTLDGSTRTGG